MKTAFSIFDFIVNFRNLWKSYNLARMGKRNRASIARFDYQAETHLLTIKRALFAGNYQPSTYRQFWVNDPKLRRISAPSFPDRIVHHALCQIIEPVFDQSFIEDSYACRRNKGTHKAMKRLQTFLRKAGTNYALKCDIAKYFANIDHEVLFTLIKRKITDSQTLNLIKKIIDSYSPGIPIGNLTSQLFANIYLNELDRFVKQTLRKKYYLRYVDDFLILGADKKELWQVFSQITVFLRKRLKLELHPRKVCLFPINKGVDFVGYVVFPDHIRLRSKNVRRFKKRLKKLQKGLAAGTVDQQHFQSSISSWVGHALHADTFRLRKTLFASPSLQAFSPTPQLETKRIHTAGGAKISKDEPPVKASAKPQVQHQGRPKISSGQLSLFAD